MSIHKKLLNVKRELGAVKKSASNLFYRSKYADLNSHLELVEPLLEKNDLILLQPCTVVGGQTLVSTIILDVDSGEKVESSMNLVGDVDMQKLGSAVTYARRYTLGALLAIQAEDDDGEASVGRTAAPGNKKTDAPKVSASARKTGGLDF